MAKIKINYADYQTVPVRKMRDTHLREIMMSSSVLLVGEGNFTFTVAFAACRKRWDPMVWNGICATRYEKEDKVPPVSLADAKVTCIQTIMEHANDLVKDLDKQDPRYQLVRDEQLRIIEQLVRLPNVPLSQSWQYGIDARALNSKLVGKYEVIWFQCPWKEGWKEGSIGKLICSFLLNMVDQISSGCYVCIGIASCFPYTKSYCLEKILGSKLCCTKGSTEVLEQYKFKGADDDFIKEILSYGYRHKGVEDIHEDILNTHVTLVFKKKKS